MTLEELNNHMLIHSSNLQKALEQAQSDFDTIKTNFDNIRQENLTKNYYKEMADILLGTKDWRWPYRNAFSIGSPFYYRERPKPGASTTHAAMDLSGSGGKNIYPINSGTVYYAGDNGGYGKTVKIAHKKNNHKIVASRYSHLSEIKVSVGQQVTSNTIIGVEGSTGTSTGSHLDLGIKLESGLMLNPVEVLPKTADLSKGIYIPSNLTSVTRQYVTTIGYPFRALAGYENTYFVTMKGSW